MLFARSAKAASPALALPPTQPGAVNAAPAFNRTSTNSQPSWLILVVTRRPAGAGRRTHQPRHSRRRRQCTRSSLAKSQRPGSLTGTGRLSVTAWPGPLDPSAGSTIGTSRLGTWPQFSHAACARRWPPAACGQHPHHPPKLLRPPRDRLGSSHPLGLGYAAPPAEGTTVTARRQHGPADLAQPAACKPPAEPAAGEHPPQSIATAGTRPSWRAACARCCGRKPMTALPRHMPQLAAGLPQSQGRRSP